MGVTAMTKVPPPSAPGGRFGKDRFDIDLDAGTVGCPAGQVAVFRPAQADGTRCASFGQVCGDCPLRADCTTSVKGRTIRVGLMSGCWLPPACSRTTWCGRLTTGRIGQGRTSSGVPGPPTPRRTPSLCLRTASRRARLGPGRCRAQPGLPGRAWAVFHHPWMASHHRMNPGQPDLPVTTAPSARH